MKARDLVATPRIRPSEPPFETETADRLRAMMRGSDVPPLALFRTFVRNMPMTRAMGGWGGYLLGPTLSIDVRTRELVIWRVCFRCGCEYEWGVHAALFATAAGFTDDEIAATATPGISPVWSDGEADIVRLVDELHDDGDLTDETWARLRDGWSEEQLLDLLMLAGWYHAVAYVATAAHLPLEPWARRFPVTR